LLGLGIFFFSSPLAHNSGSRSLEWTGHLSRKLQEQGRVRTVKE
jgi:hypothetical protein